MKRTLLLTSLLLCGAAALLHAQNGTIRGNVYDKTTGEPILYGSVRLVGTPIGDITDLNGFFSLSVRPGDYNLVVSYLGYDTASVQVSVQANAVVYQRISLAPASVQLGTVDVSGTREQARSDVQVSKVVVTAQQIKSLPATGGEADIAQYLPVLPGIISSGDQGGQLYIRGGAPIQNKILLDGMTIYNPFHTIGFFSVFETETIRSVDVLTGGFNAEYGGRISAIVDIKTREGNRNKTKGLVSVSPFQAKALVEGPIKKRTPESDGSISYLLTGKHSYLNESSRIFYNYATDTTFFAFASGDTSLASIAKDIGLPYSYTDLYGKVSFVSDNGSKLNLFGFHYADRFDFVGLAKLDWEAAGGGTNFTIVPQNSNTIMDGAISVTNYSIGLREADGNPRTSSISSYTAGLNFNYFGADNQLTYGFEFTGFNTDFQFRNLFDVTISQRDFTTELAGYFKYKQRLGGLILEPGFRVHYYASQATVSLEPRLGLKYNITDYLRFKLAGGRYAQNVLSTVNELDIVNFFVGFLAGPEQTIFEPGTRNPTQDRLQRAWHAIAGLEIDIAKNAMLNIEPYYKGFTQLISLNRNKLSGQDPDFQVETGEAYGLDFSFRHETPHTYFWATYSWAFVNRDDGEQVYPTVFDRRHNVNLLATWHFGQNRRWEAGARWNFGTGFPFTQTQGFYQDISFEDISLTDVLTGNFNLGTILSEERNGGRLSAFHRLDVSLKRTFMLAGDSRIEALLSVTNVYNRANVFYVDRQTNNRVNQLPLLPSLGLTVAF
ncbi:MAG TPA: carboxypeptidase-like regulatory domain-containing protein [Saprospiraceae bacterium]|nr:carboxypeptidase-like regulatory domain-containing protein [Saprospiraceae bacterium]HMP23393.1 carboxypeptidase-like regulatory domain-containing protein [Saprospiraceae bacterium]